MPLTTALKNTMLDAAAGAITHIGLSNAGTELTGGSPAYARQAVSFGSASSAAVSMTGTETFDVPASATVNRVILRDASTEGNDLGYATVTEEVFGAQGTYTLNSLQLTLSDPA